VDAYARHQVEVGERDPRRPLRARLSTIPGFYGYCLAEDVITRSPAANIKRPKVGSDTVSTGLDKEELAALIGAAQADPPPLTCPRASPRALWAAGVTGSRRRCGRLGDGTGAPCAVHHAQGWQEVDHPLSPADC
jgi:site-specific recombinase XerC